MTNLVTEPVETQLKRLRDQKNEHVKQQRTEGFSGGEKWATEADYTDLLKLHKFVEKNSLEDGGRSVVSMEDIARELEIECEDLNLDMPEDDRCGEFALGFLQGCCHVFDQI